MIGLGTQGPRYGAGPITGIDADQTMRMQMTGCHTPKQDRLFLIIAVQNQILWNYFVFAYFAFLSKKKNGLKSL